MLLLKKYSIQLLATITFSFLFCWFGYTITRDEEVLLFVFFGLAFTIYFFIGYKLSKHQLWLNQLYLGAGIFGIIDHIWNRELFRFTMSDILLGFLITLGITIAWVIIVTLDITLKKHSMKS